MKPAQKTHLAVLLPMPAQHIRVLLDRSFSKAETDLLKLGFIPRETDDRWFIYFENNQLHFHRSWSGVYIFQVFLTEMDGGTLRMTHAIVNRDLQQYTETRPERDAERILHLVNNFLLNHKNEND